MNTPKQTRLQAILLALALIGSSLILGACSDPGPAEEAGREIDEAVEEASDRGEDALDEARDRLEEAGDEIEEELDEVDDNNG